MGPPRGSVSLLASGRWVAGQEAGPCAGRRHCGQLCCVGASGLALCSIRAWSQTAPLLSAGTAGRQGGWTGWGEVWAAGRDRRCQGLTGFVSTHLNVRPRVKVALGAELGSVGLASGSMAAGPWGCAWAAGAGIHLYLRTAVRVAVGAFEHTSSSLAAFFCQAIWRSPALHLMWSLWSLFPSLSLSACAHGLCCFSSPTAPSLPPLCPHSLYLLLATSVSLLPPTGPLEPFSLWALSGSPYLFLSWLGLHVPVSPGAHSWVGMGGVSREESVSFSVPAAGWLPW